MDLEAFQLESTKSFETSKKLLKDLKKWSSTGKRARELDGMFQEKHEEAFEKIDCLECGNCCKTTTPRLTDRDIERISKKLRMRPADFAKQYVRKDEDNDLVFNAAPCPFLGGDNYCSIYDFRPRSCQEYPHTDRKQIRQLLDLTLDNTLVCPAVNQIVSKIGAEWEERKESNRD